MEPRKLIKLTAWPDPLVQERLEDIGFFFDQEFRTWIRFSDEKEVPSINDWLKRHHLAHEIAGAHGRGETKRLPKLSDELFLKDGGSPTRCALCGAQNSPCRQWIEGDDTDDIDYTGAKRFYMCGPCAQTRMPAHPRLYSPADDVL